MLFTFNERGLIDTVRAEERGRTVGGRVVPTPWQGRFWNYEERGGMRVPLDGEVAWLLPEGAKPYWRGHITEVVYEFARGSTVNLSRRDYSAKEPSLRTLARITDRTWAFATRAHIARSFRAPSLTPARIVSSGPAPDFPASVQKAPSSFVNPSPTSTLPRVVSATIFAGVVAGTLISTPDRPVSTPTSAPRESVPPKSSSDW